MLAARRSGAGAGLGGVVEGRGGEVGDVDEDGLALAGLGLGGVDGEEDGLEAGERGRERWGKAEEL